MYVLNEEMLVERKVMKRERIAVKCDVYGNFDLSYCTSDLRTDWLSLGPLTNFFSLQTNLTPSFSSLLTLENLSLQYDTNNRNHNNNDTIQRHPLIPIPIYSIFFSLSLWNYKTDLRFLSLELELNGTLPFWPYLITGLWTGQFRDGHKRPSLIAH